MKRSCIPYSILRATQFHEFIDQILSTFLKYPIGLLPKKILLQPIETPIVAEKLYRLSLDGASNETYEIGGAEVHTLEELANQWMIQKNKKRFVLNLPIWSTLGKTFRDGSLTTQNSKKESSSWRQWLEESKRKG